MRATDRTRCTERTTADGARPPHLRLNYDFGQDTPEDSPDGSRASVVRRGLEVVGILVLANFAGILGAAFFASLAAVGSVVGHLLPTSRAERRVLLVAGIAAGISVVFRTPLGAALLATEMLYRDDFAADALVPSIFASVVSCSVVIALFGETTLFGALPRRARRGGPVPLGVSWSVPAALRHRALHGHARGCAVRPPQAGRGLELERDHGPVSSATTTSGGAAGSRSGAPRAP